MYYVKKITESEEGGRKEENWPCRHYAVSVVPEGAAEVKQRRIEPGIYLELTLDGERRILDVSIGKPGDVVYVTNSHGETLNTYRWPLSEAS